MAVTETRVGLVVVSESGYMVAPSENAQGVPSDVLAGVQLGPTVVELDLEDRPVLAEPGSFAGDKVGDLDASAG